MVMINNIAGYAGSQIFGGFMDKCHTTLIGIKVNRQIFNEHSWQQNASDNSYVTSFPKHQISKDKPMGYIQNGS